MLKKYESFIAEKASFKNEILNEGLFGNMFKKFWEFLVKKFGNKTWLKYVMFLEEHNKIDPKKIEIYDGSEKITRADSDAKNLDDEFENDEEAQKLETPESETPIDNDEAEIISNDIKEELPKLEKLKKYKDFSLTESRSEMENKNIHIPNATMHEIKEFIEKGYRLRLEDPKGTLDPLFIWGAPGIGKTEGVFEFCEENDLMLIVWHLATIQAVDFVGVPTVIDKETIFNIPAIFPKEGTVHKGGILFFDELNRAQADVLSAALQICNDGHVGEYQLPKNWWVIAAGNREEDEPGKISELGSALSSRFSHKNLVLTSDEWISWAINKNKLHEDILAFFAIKENADKYFHYLDPDRGDHPWANPRNWVKVSKIYTYTLKHSKKNKEELDKEIRSDIASIVGLDAAATFMEFLKIKEKFTPQDIVNVYTNPSNAKMFEKERLDIGMAIMAYISFYKNKEEIPVEDLVNFYNYVERYDNYELAYVLMTYFHLIHKEITDPKNGAKYSKYFTPAFIKYSSKYKDFIRKES